MRQQQHRLRPSLANMLERSLSLWNHTIRELSQRGQGQEALQAFHQMLLEGSIPSKATYVCLMSAFTCQTDMGQGKRMHSLIMDRAFHLDVVVGTALVSMYVRCGSTIKARLFFDEMPIRNVITWTMMITAHDVAAMKMHGRPLIKRMCGMWFFGQP